MIRVVAVAACVLASACDLDSTEPPEPESAAPSSETPPDGSAIDSATPTPAAASPQDADSAKTKTPTPSETVGPAYMIGDVEARLVETDTTCLLRTGPQGSTHDLPLAFEPPCYWLLWDADPKAKKASSGGQARGSDSQPIQWFYKDVKSTAALVTGGPIPDDVSPQKAQKMLEHHCGFGWQALVIEGDVAKVREKKDGGQACQRSGLDERDFWLAAHPKP